MSAIAIVVAVAGWGAPAAATMQPGSTFSVTVDKLTPGSTLELAMDAGKIGTGTTTGTASSDGALTLALDLANRGKIDAQVDVWVGEECPDKTVRIWIVEHGMQPPPECKRRLIGAFWWGRTHHITIHFPGTLIANQGGLTTKQKVLIGAGGGAAAVGIAAAAGGGSSPTTATTPTTPSTPSVSPTPSPSPTPTPTPPPTGTVSPTGTYRVTLTVGSDPNGHNPFVGFTSVTQLTISGTGSTITITGNGPWCTLTGTITSDGNFSASGTGFVAQRSNVQSRMTGTISSSGALSGTNVVGEGSTLPNGPITYNVVGQKQ